MEEVTLSISGEERKGMSSLGLSIDEWCKEEWKDSEEILGMNREELLWQIWVERSNKLIWGLAGIIIGLLLGDIILFLIGLF